MKVRMAEATGCLVPQFVIEAETDEERIFLKTFARFPEFARDEWKMHLHGHTMDLDRGGASAINLGWVKA